MKLEYLQRPKDAGGLAMPNPWLYYLAAQLQHICNGLAHTITEVLQPNLDSSIFILLYIIKMVDLPIGLKPVALAKLNRLLPTFTYLYPYSESLK